MKDREIDGIFFKIFLRFSWFFTSSTLSLSTWKLDRFRIMDTRSSFSSSSSSAKKRFFTQRNYEFPCLNEAQLIPDRFPEGAKRKEGGRERRSSPPVHLSWLQLSSTWHVTGHAQNFWYNSRIECRSPPPSRYVPRKRLLRGVDSTN